MKSFRSNLIFAALASVFTPAFGMVPNDGGGAAPAPTSKKTVYTDVTMKKPNADGTPRVVKFAESSKVKKSLIESAEGGKPLAILFDFKNGESEQITIEQIQEWGLVDRFALHGASQKFGDAYAGDKDVDDAYESFLEIVAVAKAGKWSEEGTGRGGGSSMLLKALVELTGKTVDEVRAILGNTSDKEKLGLKQDPRIASIISRLEAEKAGAVDTSAALAALGIAAQ